MGIKIDTFDSVLCTCACDVFLQAATAAFAAQLISHSLTLLPPDARAVLNCLVNMGCPLEEEDVTVAAAFLGHPGIVRAGLCCLYDRGLLTFQVGLKVGLASLPTQELPTCATSPGRFLWQSVQHLPSRSCLRYLPMMNSHTFTYIIRLSDLERRSTTSASEAVSCIVIARQWPIRETPSIRI